MFYVGLLPGKTILMRLWGTVLYFIVIFTFAYAFANCGSEVKWRDGPPGMGGSD